MKKISVYLTVLSSVALLSGCGHVNETAKTIWGSSIRPLEQARVDARERIYECGFDSCYEAVLNLARDKSGDMKNGFFDVFQKDPVKGFIVVMGIKDSINTTEVGIFFDEMSANMIKIEVASAGTDAKEKVADIVFGNLDKQFKPAN